MATAFGIIHRFEGGTTEQYDSTLKVVHPDGGRSLPPGQTYHAAGPSDGEFVIVAIWDSEASWVKFRDETLVPAWAEAENALPGPPRETTFRVHYSQSS